MGTNPFSLALDCVHSFYSAFPRFSIPAAGKTFSFAFSVQFSGQSKRGNKNGLSGFFVFVIYFIGAILHRAIVDRSSLRSNSSSTSGPRVNESYSVNVECLGSASVFHHVVHLLYKH